MTKLKAILATLTLTLVTVLGGATTAAATETITLDSTSPGASSLPLANIATDWSNRTGVTVNVAPCTGDNCIHILIVDHPCPTSGVTTGMVGGCAKGSPDPGACEVQINDSLTWWTEVLYATKHEVGHCIYWFGGAGFIHLKSTKALMKAGFAGVPTANQTKLTAEDRKFALNLYR